MRRHTAHWAGRGSTAPAALGCDAIAANALEAVAETRRLVGLAAEKLTLEEQLSVMGRRIHSMRTSQGMTQGRGGGLDST